MLEISAEPSRKITPQDGNYNHTFNNFNIFSGNKGFIGGKTGYTKDANGTMLSIFSLLAGDEVRDIAVIVLNSDDREGDTKKIFEWLKKALDI